VNLLANAVIVKCSLETRGFWTSVIVAMTLICHTEAIH
jgi:hypothetical protein